jgi:GTP-binding protein
MLTYCTEIELPCYVLLTKADKLSRNEAAKTLAAVRKECTANGWPAQMQLFSALAKTGVDEARMALGNLLNA